MECDEIAYRMAPHYQDEEFQFYMYVIKELAGWIEHSPERIGKDLVYIYYFAYHGLYGIVTVNYSVRNRYQISENKALVDLFVTIEIGPFHHTYKTRITVKQEVR